jgi:hypothetical protein
MRKHIWLSVVAVGMLAYGGHCLREAPAMREAIESLPEMTCEQLVCDGPGGHQFVVLTDAALSSGRSVAQRDSESGTLELYHPIYSAANAKEPPAVEFTLILGILDESDRRRVRVDWNQRQTKGLTGVGRLTVKVTQTADQLPAWAQEGLANNYRGILLSRCRVVTIGLDEPTAAHARRLQWLGILYSVGGLITLCWCGWIIRVRSSSGDRVEPETGAACLTAPSAPPVANSRSADGPSQWPADSGG